MRALALALALLLAIPAVPRAETAAPRAASLSEAPIIRAELLPGWETPEGRRMMGLRLTLADGWKTYWRSPGAGGLAPVLDFGGSRGVEGVEAHWPVPHLFHLGGLRSIGYSGTVTIPIEVTLSGGPARLSGALSLGVCRDVCVPVDLAVALDLPADAGRRDPAIAASLVDQPRPAAEAGAVASCAVAPDAGGGVSLTVRVVVPPQGGEEAVVVESSDPGLWLSEARTWREDGTLVAEAMAEARDGGPVSLDRSALRITVLGDGRAVDIRGCPAG